MTTSIVPDIRIVQNNAFPKYSVTCDWSLRDNGTLDDTKALASAIIVALGTDGLASVSDVLPDPDSEDRRGWWGDYDAEAIWNGWAIGSKLWLLVRSKITPSGAAEGSTLVAIETYIRDSLQPFVNRRICSFFDVWVNRVDKQRIDALIRIYRGPLLEIELRYQILWQEMIQDQG
jgi:phage gp46-like protein